MAGGDGTFLLDSGLAKVSVMELVHNGFLYPRETKAVSPMLACRHALLKLTCPSSCHLSLMLLPPRLLGSTHGMHALG